MKLFEWDGSIPRYPRSASRGIEFLMSFPMVSLYIVKSCALPLVSCVNDFPSVPLKYDLGLQSVAFFFPEYYACCPAFGWFRGLSETSTRIYRIDSDVLFSAFFPGRAKVRLSPGCLPPIG
jgi:hypothetical protein